MDKRGGISKDKLASGLLRGAVVSGLAAGLAAASLGGVPTASATCIGISGININLGDGGGCFSTVGSFALGLGPNTVATSAGLLTSAIAIGFGNEQTELTQATSFGFLSLALAGGPDTLAQTNGSAGVAIMGGENGRALAGSSGTGVDSVNLAINFGNGLDTPPPLGGATGNPTLDTQTNTVASSGQGSIAVNIGGDSIPGVGGGDPRLSVVQAGGVTLNPLAVSFANASYNFFGDGNQVAVGDQGSNFGLGFSVFGDRNDVVVNGPAAAGGALFQSDRLVEQTGPGIEINGVEKPTGSTTNVLAAGGTQRNLLRPSLNFRPGLNSTSNLGGTSPGGAVLKSINQLQSSAKNFGDQLQSSAKNFGDQLQSSAKKFGDQLQSSAKKFGDQLQSSVKESGDSVNATRAGAKADTASSSEGDNGR